jgi:predicted nucleotidyltransferase
MSAANEASQASADARWSTRLREDRRRAVELQTSSQREATETIRQRAVARGVEAVALTGSTVRARRTALSDLDFMIVGERPDSSGIREDVDVYAASAKAFWERLLAGDDYIQWTLRFGCILHDAGILRAANRHIEENGLMPSAERKRIQVHRGLSLAWCVLDSGDIDAAREQCRAALTTIARWLLIASGEFPLSRDELSEQLLMLGCPELAAALHRVIHNEPSLAELRIGLRLGENLITAPPRPTAHAYRDGLVAVSAQHQPRWARGAHDAAARRGR